MKLTTTRCRVLLPACVLSLIWATRSVSAASPAELTQRLRNAAALSSLDTPDTRPWHLKVELQLYDEAGKPSEQGTVEEWWASPTLYRIVYTSPSYTGATLHNADGFYRTQSAGSESTVTNLILQQVVHPMPSEEEIQNATLDERTESFGTAKLDCVMLGEAIKGLDSTPFGLFPMYCMDHKATSLRVVFAFGDLAITRNKIGTFLQRTVPLEVSANNNGKLLVMGKVTALGTAGLTAADFVPTDAMRKTNESPTKVATGVTAGHLIESSQVHPNYPQSAKNSHVSGQVILRALIGRDGHIRRLTPMSYPRADLAVSALLAVRHWRYTPYLLNGEPTEIDTTITVYYNFR